MKATKKLANKLQKEYKKLPSAKQFGAESAAELAEKLVAWIEKQVKGENNARP